MTISDAWQSVHEIPPEHHRIVEIGPLKLCLMHVPGDWRIGWKREDPEASTDRNEMEPLIAGIPDLDSSFQTQRFLSQNDGDSLRLSARLADRPIVARPESPLVVPAGDEARIFVSTPIWIACERLDPERLLTEIPTVRPTDTWFGPDTRRGEIAYATRTTARVRLANLPRRSFRAVTAVTVRNQTASGLTLERLSVPAPNLTLYVDAEGFFWTTQLSVVHDSETMPENVGLLSATPPEAVDARIVASPRRPIDKNVFSRALRILTR